MTDQAINSGELGADTILLGGTVSSGRLYLEDCAFILPDGRHVVISKTDVRGGANMPDLIARHKGRYSLLGLFSRPGGRLLDFPCGSGYAASLLKDFDVIYEGRDIDVPTLEYAKRIYGGDGAMFLSGDLCAPSLDVEQYDVIACIEGIEHIDTEFQSPLVAALYTALKTGGTLVVSSPESSSGVSGPSDTNKYHKHELTRQDFLSILHEYFEKQNVEVVSNIETLHTGVRTTCLYGVCHKM